MNWKWDSLTTYNNYTDRIEKAQKSVVLDLNNDLYPSACIQGQSGERHYCTLENCDCKGFVLSFKRREPCFHMIRLAMEVGILDEKGMTKQERINSDINSIEAELSRYSWYYYVLNKPLVSNSKYDELKAEYYKKTGINNEKKKISSGNSIMHAISKEASERIGVIIPHAKYFNTIWRVIDINNKYATLWSYPIIDMPFFDLDKCHEARYIRTDFSGKNKEGKLLKVQESEIREGNDNNAAQRYSDITQYGSNQWAVSTVREYLNGEFITGFPDSFINAIIPQTHDILLRKVMTSEKKEKCTEHRVYDDSTTVFDSFRNGIRSTYSRVTDRMYLPSLEIDMTFKTFFSNTMNMVQTNHYWLMDAQINTDGAPYLVKVVTNCLDTKGRYYASVSSCNARQNHGIWLCPICIVNIDYLESIFQ